MNLLEGDDGPAFGERSIALNRRGHWQGVPFVHRRFQDSHDSVKFDDGLVER